MVYRHYISDAAKENLRGVLPQPGLRSALPTLLGESLSAFAFLPRIPEPWEEAHLDRCIVGAYPDVNREYTQRQAEFVSDFIATGERHCFLLQYWLSKTRRETVRVGTIEEPIVFEVKDEAAWYVEEDWNTFDRDRNCVETIRIILESRYLPFAVGILTEYPAGFQRNRPVHRGDARLQVDLLRAARYLMICSYDMEAWLVVPVGREAD